MRRSPFSPSRSLSEAGLIPIGQRDVLAAADLATTGLGVLCKVPFGQPCTAKAGNTAVFACQRCSALLTANLAACSTPADTSANFLTAYALASQPYPEAVLGKDPSKHIL